ncbi:hypothetical protein [Aquiflexum sp.]|uniref:hypothetical protein n=1 Tax=Aquiflexum sp. TaxID=1872584 RepID=UPI0035932709
MKFKILILSLFFLSFHLSGQVDGWGIPKIIDFPRLDKISLDNQGFIFLADLEGNLYQYSKDAKFLNNFSPPRQGSLSQLEAFWTVNIFTFSADLQEYRILDRFINPVAENRIPMDLINLAKAATLGNNNIIWVFDETDLSLKQFDYIRNRIIQNQPLNLIIDRSSLEIVDIKEYQNLLFLNIRDEGVFILDNQGNFIKKLMAKPTQKLGFWKGYLIYLEDDKIVLLNFQSEKVESINIPTGIKAKGILVNQNQIHFYDANQVWIFDKSKTPANGIF